jgi:hypothetical protein
VGVFFFWGRGVGGWWVCFFRCFPKKRKIYLLTVLGDRKSWAGTYRLLVYFSDNVEGRRSRQLRLGREGGRAGYVARLAGTEEMMMMLLLQQETDLKKWDLKQHRYHSTLELLQRASCWCCCSCTWFIYGHVVHAPGAVWTCGDSAALGWISRVINFPKVSIWTQFYVEFYAWGWGEPIPTLVGTTV